MGELLEQKQYPQLKEPGTSDDVDLDEYEFAKFEAIQKASEKEYLNAILSTLNTHTALLNKISYTLLTILLIGIYFLIKSVIAK